MKLAIPTLAAATMIGLSNAEITSNSRMGQKLLSSARRLDAAANDGADEIDYTWLSNYSLKFQGCHATPQWNEDANGEDSIKLATLNLVRFRLCPASDCSMASYGCKSGYGDYIVSMDIFLQSYLDSVLQDQDYSCEYARSNECGCYNNGDYDSFEKCEYDCFMDRGMEYCVSNNPYAEDYNGGNQYQQEDEEEWDMMDMVQCQELNGAGYYTGAYCSNDGGSIFMGVFTDDTCSNLADIYGGQDIYTTITGKELPHAQSTLIGNECMSCKEGGDANYNDQQDADDVKEGCEALYLQAGKCEKNLNDDGSGNNNACQFMEGINMVYKNGGMFSSRSHSSSSAAGVFIGLFSCSFFLLSTYAYYLKSKLDRAKVQLIDDL